jgi:hypothetical protein
MTSLTSTSSSKSHRNYLSLTPYCSAPCLPPPKLLPKPQNLLDLPIAHRRLPIPKLPYNLRLRTNLLEPLSRPPLLRQRTLIINGIEHLEPKPVRLQAPLNHVPEVPRIGVAPRMHFEVAGPREIRIELGGMVCRCDHGPDSQAVDVDAGEAQREGVRDALHAYFGCRVHVHGVRGGGLGKWEVRVGDVAFGVAGWGY